MRGPPASCVAAAALCLVGLAPPAAARPVLHRCGRHLECGRVYVPLDPSGRVPGRIGLYVKRFASSTHPRGAFLALAGGPGQSAVELLPKFRSDLRPVLGQRALVVFDVRGVGRSGPLSCRATIRSLLKSHNPFAVCARRLGRRAAFYSTYDTVADMEAVRRALGVGRMAILGVSYGTFPELQYARRFPTRVDHLVLDSTVPADGEPAVNLGRVAAMRAMLGSICAGDCRGMSPIVDLGALLTNAARAPKRTSPRRGLFVASARLLGGFMYSTLLESDLDPRLRASIPAALHLGAGGVDSALSRLLAIEFAGASTLRSGLADRAAGLRVPGGSVSLDLENTATSCEDARLPWSARDPLAVRKAKTSREEATLPSAVIAPFTPATIVDTSLVPHCEQWPQAGDNPPRVSAPFPRVPTLILSGDDDVRTPPADAIQLAGQIPGAALVQVPNVGHSVLTRGKSSCTARALLSFMANRAVAPCPPAPPAPVDPLPPASVAALPPAAPLAGTPGSVLDGVVLTLRHDVEYIFPAPVELDAAEGTLGGEVGIRRGRIELRQLSYVRGLALTGTLRRSHTGPHDPGHVTVDLDGHPYGTITLSASGTIDGTLGGQRFTLPAPEREALVRQAGLSGLGR